jgi:acid phosphatase
MDVDETVLDNSAYQARLIRKGEQWNPSSWDDWIEERSALPVPGALAFVKRAKAEGVTVIFVTNRQCSVRENANVSLNDGPCPQKLDTAENLVNAGYPLLSSSDLLALRGERVEWGDSEKRERRKYFSQRYRIIMLIGDDLGDLAPNIKGANVAERNWFVKTHQSLFGEYWFQLANPIYGSWQRAVNYEDKLDYLRYK